MTHKKEPWSLWAKLRLRVYMAAMDSGGGFRGMDTVVDGFL